MLSPPEPEVDFRLVSSKTSGVGETKEVHPWNQTSDHNSASHVPTELFRSCCNKDAESYTSMSCGNTQEKVYGVVETSIPVFTLKYGKVLIPVHANVTDCHVEDLAHAFHDKQFAKRVLNSGNI